MDTRIDGTERGHRALADLFHSRKDDLQLLEVISPEGEHDTPEQRQQFAEMLSRVESRFEALAVALDDAGVLARTRAGKPLGVTDVPWPSSTDVIRDTLGIGALAAWKELSGVAHGSPTALVRQTQSVGVDDAEAGMHVVQGRLPLPALVPRLAIVHFALTYAIHRMVVLRGWDRTRWRSWTVEAGREVSQLLRENAAQPPS
jgi:hypothetical protein